MPTGHTQIIPEAYAEHMPGSPPIWDAAKQHHLDVLAVPLDILGIYKKINTHFPLK